MAEKITRRQFLGELGKLAIVTGVSSSPLYGVSPVLAQGNHPVRFPREDEPKEPKKTQKDVFKKLGISEEFIGYEEKGILWPCVDNAVNNKTGEREHLHFWDIDFDGIPDVVEVFGYDGNGNLHPKPKAYVFDLGKDGLGWEDRLEDPLEDGLNGNEEWHIKRATPAKKTRYI